MSVCEYLFFYYHWVYDYLHLPEFLCLACVRARLENQLDLHFYVKKNSLLLLFRSPCLCREYGIVHLTHTNVNVTEREYYKFRIYFSIWFCCCQILCSQFIFGIECKNCSSVISSQFRVCFLLLKSFHFCFALKFRREMCVSCLCILYTISAFYYIRSYCIFHSIKLEFGINIKSCEAVFQ